MGLGSDETHAGVLRAAILAIQLPHSSRTVVAMAPAAQNGTAEHLLRQIEVNQRNWHWAHSKDGQRGANQPKWLTLPGEEEQAEMAREREERKQSRVADALGLSL